jgi:FixJ family two-component response regulator
MNPIFPHSSRTAVLAIVDDDAAVLKAAQRLLCACGFHTEIFSSGRAFLDALRSLSPDCVLLDLHMPGLTGWEVRDEMGAAGFSIPVIFITGDGDPALWERAAAAGAVALLRKPFGEQALLETIATAIG